MAHSRTAIALVILCCACRNARLCLPSRTSLTTSAPRTAGRSWRKIVLDDREVSGFDTSAIIDLDAKRLELAGPLSVGLRFSHRLPTCGVNDVDILWQPIDPVMLFDARQVLIGRDAGSFEQ